MGITKSELVGDLANKAGVTHAQAEDVLNGLIESIENELVFGREVRLPKLGTFKSQHVNAREGKNPSTGEPLHIEAHNKVKFTPASSLKEAVRNS